MSSSNRILDRLSKFDFSHVDYEHNDNMPEPYQENTPKPQISSPEINDQYAGTVFDFNGNLSQQLLKRIKPNLGTNSVNPHSIEESILVLENAITTLKKKKIRKNQHSTSCDKTMKTMQELSEIQDLLYSYRVALFAG